MLERVRPKTLPDEFIEFFARGAVVKGEFQCAECGFAVTVHTTLPQCPVCRGESWEQHPWSPFTRRHQSL